jgi:hypothetical protein
MQSAGLRKNPSSQGSKHWPRHMSCPDGQTQSVQSSDRTSPVGQSGRHCSPQGVVSGGHVTGVLVAVGGTGVSVAVGGTGVSVAVGGTGVSVGVLVGTSVGMLVAVSGTGVLVAVDVGVSGSGVLVGVSVGVLVLWVMGVLVGVRVFVAVFVGVPVEAERHLHCWLLKTCPSGHVVETHRPPQRRLLDPGGAFGPQV